MSLTVAPPRPARAATRPRYPMTKLGEKRYGRTFRGARQCWGARSASGLWDYERMEDAGTTWGVLYLPTGQTRMCYGTLDKARRATAAELLAELLAEAVTAALSDNLATATNGRRWLAGHRRMNGAAGADLRCECGGYLVELPAGKVAHVDACAECSDLVGFAAVCAYAGEHKWCATPATVMCGHNRDNGCTDAAAPNDGDGCGRAGAADCCRACCWPGC